MENKVIAEDKKIIVRPVKPEDIPAIRDLAVEGFGEEVAFKIEHYEKQVETFPEGQRCVEYDGKIVGASGSLIVSREEWERDHTFAEICDDGYIRNHKPGEKNLYGIEVVVDKNYRNLKIGKKLYQARKDLCKDLGLERILIGGRIPNYHKYESKLTPEEYAYKVENQEIFDPVMRFQLNNDFSFLKIMRNYLPEDEESRFHAALMEWRNEA